jgi:transposase
MQFETRLHARVPRIECPEHGVVQIGVPWAQPGSRFTMLFEGRTIDWLQEASVQAVSRQLGTSWDETWTIMRRSVERGLERRQINELREIGVDEKSFQRRHDYVTVVTGLIGSRVLYVADDRTQESLEAFWAMGLTDAQRAGIEAIAMDMWEPYVQATLARIPGAESKIVFDRFHIAKHLNDGVDRVRRAEAKELRAAATIGWSERSTPGCAPRTTSTPRRGGSSRPCARATSKWRGPGRSGRLPPSCGTTATSALPARSSGVGTTGRPTRGLGR